MARRNLVAQPFRRALPVVAAVALSAGILVAGSSAAHPDTAAPGKTVHVIEHAITDVEAPGAGGADVKGNVLTFNNPIFDVHDRRVVGRDEGFCTRLAPKQGIWECAWTTFLKGGQISVQGPYNDTRNTVLSITGGTGAYRRSRGEMRLLSRNGGKEYDFVFNLS
ncbi:MAG: hypothetical protein NVS4B3_23550 [Gemmatimonadaceae bacterium]